MKSSHEVTIHGIFLLSLSIRETTLDLSTSIQLHVEHVNSRILELESMNSQRPHLHTQCSFAGVPYALLFTYIFIQ